MSVALFVCGIILFGVIWFSSSEKPEPGLTPTNEPRVTDTSPRPLSDEEKSVILSKYADTFPKDSMKRERDDSMVGEIAIRLELSKEDWKRIREDKMEKEWEQQDLSISTLPSRYVGATISMNESKRVFESWSHAQLMNISRQREIIETIWVMNGENEGTILVLYVIKVSP